MDRDKMISYIKEKTNIIPKAGIVLGSGLGDAYSCVKDATYIPYSDIPGFPTSTVAGHAGRFVLGYIEEVPVILMQGRVHYYEGYSMEAVVLPVRIMGMLGIDTLLLTNAAGGIAETLLPGDIMIIEDHISSFITSPLIGANDETLGVRFPDMTQVYDREYIDILKDAFHHQKMDIKQGVYIQVSGPQYETPAEIRMYKKLGADAVGMSTVCEAIAARHMGIKVAGLSSICNKAAGLGGELSHTDIIDMSRQMSDKLIKIMIYFMKEYKRRYNEWM
ncbi:MAG: purine-nucleoside phosphorylase [Coprococcus sp.]|nr:purine-nucleoside phosphorylase [Coprococcus sp.]